MHATGVYLWCMAQHLHLDVKQSPKYSLEIQRRCEMILVDAFTRIPLESLTFSIVLHLNPVCNFRTIVYDERLEST